MDKREDAGQFYPGGKVVPRQPVRPGGGGASVVLDDTVTEESVNGVKSSGIWSWVKSLLPTWLTASREEPPTVESVNGKRERDDADFSNVDSVVFGGNTHPLAQFDVKCANGSIHYDDENCGFNFVGPLRVTGRLTSNDKDVATEDQLPSDEQLLTEDQAEEIAKVKGKADEFTEWEGVPSPYELRWRDEDGSVGWCLWAPAGFWVSGTQGNRESVRLEFYQTSAGDFTATRRRVLRTGDVTSLPYLRVWDEQSQCWWKGVMQGGVLNWEVEEGN